MCETQAEAETLGYEDSRPIDEYEMRILGTILDANERYSREVREFIGNGGDPTDYRGMRFGSLEGKIDDATWEEMTDRAQDAPCDLI